VDPEWVEVTTNKIEEWIEAVDGFKGQHKMVVFVLDRFSEHLYKKLKTHSLCTAGYQSQCIRAESLRKNAMSVASKLLLQMNYKMGGCTYKIDFPKEITNCNLMLVGVDSSHISGKRTGVAMSATISGQFTSFYNKIDIITEEKASNLHYCISSFLQEAIGAYFKKNQKNTNKLPSGIVIYRQGVSKEQKEFLKSEVAKIEAFLSGTEKDTVTYGHPIPYYYIIVNTKNTFKFFETESKQTSIEYFNPSPGLLVIDEITDPDSFEFYIQPQEVKQGTATPTSYQVAFGNLNVPELIPKLTYDLCFLYANWQGAVRVPSVLKCAEKLSKMTAKYTRGELHKNLKNTLCYL